MQPKSSVFIATSLDGFIARQDGSIDWLESASDGSSTGDFGYKEFFDSVDALIMGRNTFEKVLTFPEWSYGEKPVIVLSNSLHALPASAPSTVSLSKEAPKELIERLVSEGMHNFYIDGGATIQGFLNAGQIDELTITLIPVVLGTGIPLFGPVDQDVALELVVSQSFPCGFVQNKYRVLHNQNGR